MSIVRLHLGDCLPAMRAMPDKAYDLAIVDVPYGIDGNCNRKSRHKGKLAYLNRQYHDALWSQEVPDQEYFDQLFRVSKHQIIWGINYLVGIRNVPIGPGRIVWDKCNGATSYSDAEIAGCSLIESVRLFRYMWNGMMQGRSIGEGHRKNGDTSYNEIRIHPTQKPKKLYSYLLQNFAEPGWKIFDSHAGSGTMLRAALDLEFDAEAWEIDPVYYADNLRELNLYKTQHKVPFTPVTPKQILLEFDDITPGTIQSSKT